MKALDQGRAAEGATAEQEDARRKRAESIIKKALRGAEIPLRNRGVFNRFMPGLWAATVTLLIECLDVEDVMRLLTSRMPGLTRPGENDRSPPGDMEGGELDDYAEEVALAANTISEGLEAAIASLEKEELDDRLPEAMLDCAIFVLARTWGPGHTRRAAVEQMTAFLKGARSPMLFMEPKEMLPPAEATTGDGGESRAPDREPAPEPAEESAEVHPLPALRERRSVRVFFDYDIETDGRWAACAHKASPEGVEEMHLFRGPINDANGRRAPVVAVIEIMKSLTHEHADSLVVIECDKAYALKGMGGDPDLAKAHRRDEEADLWRDFDALVRGRRIVFNSVQNNVSDILQHMCGFVMGRKLTDLAHIA